MQLKQEVCKTIVIIRIIFNNYDDDNDDSNNDTEMTRDKL